MPNKGAPMKGKMAWNIATTENTLPISSGFTILVIIDRNTVVDVESRNAIALPIYSIHSVVQNAHISVFITDVGASVKRKAHDRECLLENLIDRNVCSPLYGYRYLPIRDITVSWTFRYFENKGTNMYCPVSPMHPAIVIRRVKSHIWNLSTFRRYKK